MPVPFNLVSDQSFYGQESGKESLIDVSFLANSIPNFQTTAQSDKIMVTAADKNATLLMKIWSMGEKKENGSISVAEGTGITSSDVMRLKGYGLVTGSLNAVEITNRGKAIITVMTLGESNSFEKRSKKKSYTEIMASTNKSGKEGYRTPFGPISHLIQTNADVKKI